MTITTATASRRGTRERNCDGAAIHYVPDSLVVAAALIDGIGNSAEVAEFARLAAEVAARVGARRTATIGILAAAELISAPAAAVVEPDGVAVLAIAEPYGHTAIAWTGDSRAYGWDGDTLTQRTTDMTVGEYLRHNGGGPIELLAKAHDNWIRSSLGRSSIATVHAAACADPLILLTTDGVHDQLPQAELEALVREHQDAPATLADAIVNTVQPKPSGYRDDATVIVLAADLT
ncbi:SpoIIE family protein phosphatase [Streptomyces sp. NBC_01511]|uniref:PP2C family protein-serine/threonine phosphatase n=1 Tax=Streptomyces sp. NBC_01511 TaxID=2903889 RepID=UPI00386AB4B0